MVSTSTAARAQQILDENPDRLREFMDRIRSDPNYVLNLYRNCPELQRVLESHPDLRQIVEDPNRMIRSFEAVYVRNGGEPLDSDEVLRERERERKYLEGMGKTLDDDDDDDDYDDGSSVDDEEKGRNSRRRRHSEDGSIGGGGGSSTSTSTRNNGDGTSDKKTGAAKFLTNARSVTLTALSLLSPVRFGQKIIGCFAADQSDDYGGGGALGGILGFGGGGGGADVTKDVVSALESAADAHDDPDVSDSMNSMLREAEEGEREVRDRGSGSGSGAGGNGGAGNAATDTTSTSVHRTLDEIIEENDHLRNLRDTNPVARSFMTDVEGVRLITDPDNLRACCDLAEAMEADFERALEGGVGDGDGDGAGAGANIERDVGEAEAEAFPDVADEERTWGSPGVGGGADGTGVHAAGGGGIETLDRPWDIGEEVGNGAYGGDGRDGWNYGSRDDGYDRPPSRRGMDGFAEWGMGDGDNNYGYDGAVDGEEARGGYEEDEGRRRLHPSAAYGTEMETEWETDYDDEDDHQRYEQEGYEYQYEYEPEDGRGYERDYRDEGRYQYDEYEFEDRRPYEGGGGYDAAAEEQKVEGGVDREGGGNRYDPGGGDDEDDEYGQSEYDYGSDNGGSSGGDDDDNDDLRRSSLSMSELDSRLEDETTDFSGESESTPSASQGDVGGGREGPAHHDSIPEVVEEETEGGSKESGRENYSRHPEWGAGTEGDGASRNGISVEEELDDLSEEEEEDEEDNDDVDSYEEKGGSGGGGGRSDDDFVPVDESGFPAIGTIGLFDGGGEGINHELKLAAAEAAARRGIEGGGGSSRNVRSDRTRKAHVSSDAAAAAAGGKVHTREKLDHVDDSAAAGKSAAAAKAADVADITTRDRVETERMGRVIEEDEDDYDSEEEEDDGEGRRRRRRRPSAHAEPEEDTLFGWLDQHRRRLAEAAAADAAAEAGGGGAETEVGATAGAGVDALRDRRTRGNREISTSSSSPNSEEKEELDSVKFSVVGREEERGRRRRKSATTPEEEEDDGDDDDHDGGHDGDGEGPTSGASSGWSSSRRPSTEGRSYYSSSYHGSEEQSVGATEEEEDRVGGRRRKYSEDTDEENTTIDVYGTDEADIVQELAGIGEDVSGHGGETSTLEPEEEFDTVGVSLGVSGTAGAMSGGTYLLSKKNDKSGRYRGLDDDRIGGGDDNDEASNSSSSSNYSESDAFQAGVAGKVGDFRINEGGLGTAKKSRSKSHSMFAKNFGGAAIDSEARLGFYGSVVGGIGSSVLDVAEDQEDRERVEGPTTPLDENRDGKRRRQEERRSKVQLGADRPQSGHIGDHKKDASNASPESLTQDQNSAYDQGLSYFGSMSSWNYPPPGEREYLHGATEGGTEPLDATERGDEVSSDENLGSAGKQRHDRRGVQSAQSDASDRDSGSRYYKGRYDQNNEHLRELDVADQYAQAAGDTRRTHGEEDDDYLSLEENLLDHYADTIARLRGRGRSDDYVRDSDSGDENEHGRTHGRGYDPEYYPRESDVIVQYTEAEGPRRDHDRDDAIEQGSDVVGHNAQAKARQEGFDQENFIREGDVVDQYAESGDSRRGYDRDGDSTLGSDVVNQYAETGDLRRGYDRRDGDSTLGSDVNQYARASVRRQGDYQDDGYSRESDAVDQYSETGDLRRVQDQHDHGSQGSVDVGQYGRTIANERGYDRGDDYSRESDPVDQYSEASDSRRIHDRDDSRIRGSDDFDQYAQAKFLDQGYDRESTVVGEYDETGDSRRDHDPDDYSTQGSDIVDQYAQVRARQEDNDQDSAYSHENDVDQYVEPRYQRQRNDRWDDGYLREGDVVEQYAESGSPRRGYNQDDYSAQGSNVVDQYGQSRANKQGDDRVEEYLRGSDVADQKAETGDLRQEHDRDDDSTQTTDDVDQYSQARVDGRVYVRDDEYSRESDIIDRYEETGDSRRGRDSDDYERQGSVDADRYAQARAHQQGDDQDDDYSQENDSIDQYEETHDSKRAPDSDEYDKQGSDDADRYEQARAHQQGDDQDDEYSHGSDIVDQHVGTGDQGKGRDRIEDGVRQMEETNPYTYSTRADRDDGDRDFDRSQDGGSDQTSIDQEDDEAYAQSADRQQSLDFVGTPEPGQGDSESCILRVEDLERAMGTTASQTGVRDSSNESMGSINAHQTSTVASLDTSALHASLDTSMEVPSAQQTSLDESSHTGAQTAPSAASAMSPWYMFYQGLSQEIQADFDAYGRSRSSLRHRRDGTGKDRRPSEGRRRPFG